MNDFEEFAVSNGIGTNKLDGYNKYIVKNGIISPTILEERSLNVIGLDIFSRLQYDRILFLGTVIDEDVANIINAQLLYLNSIGDDDIKMVINSPGGSCIDGLAIYDVMNFVTPDISTYCMGMCASMASILVSSGTKGKRYILPNGEVMIHQLRGGSQGVMADMKIDVAHAEQTQNKLYNILAKNTGKTFAQIEKDADRDNWFTAEASVEYGLIDKIVTKSE